MNKDKIKKFLFGASGIFICYLYFGILQEDITRSHYKLPDGTYEIFVYPTCLVFFYCFVNMIFAKILNMTIFKGEDTTRQMYYFMNAISYVLAMVCGNMSLQFINYPTHIVGKTIKPLFMMVIGVLLGKKQYTLKKYFFVILIITGAILFMYKDKEGPSTKKGFNLGFGELLLFLSLIMDGFTGGIQDRMIAEHQTKPMPLMYNVNKFAIVIAGTIVLLTGEFFQFLEFLRRHPFILRKLLMLSLVSSCGQGFIFLFITEFGPVSCAIVATVRKLFSVLISVLFLGNTLLPRQWLATVILFTGLFLDIYYGKSPKPK